MFLFNDKIFHNIFFRTKNKMYDMKNLYWIRIGYIFSIQSISWWNKRFEGKGAPSFLRLKANGLTYKLPVVPSSIK